MNLQDFVHLHQKTLQAIRVYDYFQDVFQKTFNRYPTISDTENVILISQFWIDFLKTLPKTANIKRFPYNDIRSLVPNDYL